MVFSAEKIRILTAYLAPDFLQTETPQLPYNWSVSSLDGRLFLFVKDGNLIGNKLEVDSELGLLRNGNSPALLESLHACLTYIVGERNLKVDELPAGGVDLNLLSKELGSLLRGFGDKSAINRFAGKISSALVVNVRQAYFSELYATGQPPAQVEFGYYLPARAKIRHVPFFSRSFIEVLSALPIPENAKKYASDKINTQGISNKSLGFLREACRIILEKETQHV